MLVVSRQRDEQIVIGDSIVLRDNIVITVVDIRGDKVRLGIDADKSITVHRREVYDSVVRAQKEKKETVLPLHQMYLSKKTAISHKKR